MRCFLALAAARNLPRRMALPNASSIVKPHALVSLDPVPRGKDFQVAVVVDIARGFHMNSHKPTDEYLIPTTLTAATSSRIRAQRHDLSEWTAREILVFPE